MSSEDAPSGDTQIESADPPKSPTEPTSATETKKRPRLDVSALAGGRDRKRGKSMFGLLVGTLNKAKIEDKERNASDAAKKRQLIEQRLQAKLRKETDSVRRAEEAKKDKTTANRKEEELQLKDSVYKLSRKRLPLLSNFLLTSDEIPTDDPSALPPPTNPTAPPPRSHPPPLYYLPSLLTTAQEAFLARRKAEVAEAAEKEWSQFLDERKAGIEDIHTLRRRVAEEEAKKASDPVGHDEMETDTPREEAPPASKLNSDPSKDADMEVDDGVTSKDDKSPSTILEPDKKEDSAPMQADDEDAVEY